MANNHIHMRNKRAGNTQFPQGTDFYYPYPLDLSVEQGEAQWQADINRLVQLIAVMPGQNRLRAVSLSAKPLFWVGRNGDGAGGGSLSIYAYELARTARLTGRNGYSSTVDMEYKAAGWSRTGLIPGNILPTYASLHNGIANSTYLIEILDGLGRVVYAATVEVTSTGPELAVRINEATDPTPSTSGYTGGTLGAPPAAGADEQGTAYNTSQAPVLPEN